MHVNRDLANELGLDVGQIARHRAHAARRPDRDPWEDPSGEERDVVVQIDPGRAAPSRQDLASLPIATPVPRH